MHAQRLLQEVDDMVVVVNPPYPPMTTEELDASFDLPYTRVPHLKYKGKRIPAYEMIKHSVNIHRVVSGVAPFVPSPPIRESLFRHVPKRAY